MIDQTKKIHVNGMDVVYYDAGKGTPVLLLHGALLCAQTYRLTIASLSKKHRVIAPDVPGFGRSTVPEKIWDFHEYARFFATFIEKLGLSDITVIGHSFGGGIALALGLMTNRITKMVLINSAGLPFYYSRVKFLSLLLNEIVTGPFRYRRFRPAYYCIKDFLVYCVTRPHDLARMTRILERSTQKAYNFKRAKSIPTLILHGVKDQIFPYRYAKQLHLQISRSIFQRVNGDHGWCLYKGDQLCSLIGSI